MIGLAFSSRTPTTAAVLLVCVLQEDILSKFNGTAQIQQLLTRERPCALLDFDRGLAVKGSGSPSKRKSVNRITSLVTEIAVSFLTFPDELGISLSARTEDKAQSGSRIGCCLLFVTRKLTVLFRTFPFYWWEVMTWQSLFGA